MIEMVGVAIGPRAKPRITHCSLQVGRGEIVAVVGASGSGKSLILDVLTGHRRATRGVSQIAGLDPADKAGQVRRLVTQVPEEGQLDPSLTLWAQLVWWASLLQIRTEPVTIRRSLRALEIPDRYFHLPGRSAPPECKILLWLAFAQLRAHQILLIDDPVRSTSIAATRTLSRVFRALAQQGASIIVTTRDAAFAEATADQVIILESGRTQLARPTLQLHLPTRS